MKYYLSSFREVMVHHVGLSYCVRMDWPTWGGVKTNQYEYPYKGNTSKMIHKRPPPMLSFFFKKKKKRKLGFKVLFKPYETQQNKNTFFPNE